ncbi:MAG: GGDEF domain-containing protein [Clostridia bacterium]|nr:GGDEF domain-containing protein [Clostridia bacterium]
MAIIIVCVVSIGAMSILSIQRTAQRASTQHMNELCVAKASEINGFLDEIRQDVEIAAHHVTDAVSAVALVEGGVVGAEGTGESLPPRDWDGEQQRAFDAYLSDYIAECRAIFHSISYNTSSAMTYFYRLNPEISRDVTGFLFTRQGVADFQEAETTDVLAYSPEDTRHVGWYYQALDRGRPTWLPPYLNVNLGDTVTTFIAPVYKAGTFVGVAGMDVSYHLLVEEIQNLDIYDTGYAFLTDEFGKIIYHPYLSTGALLSEVNNELRAETTRLYMNRDSDSLVEYSYQGGRKRAAWTTLNNGLRLFVTAPVQEIEAEWRVLIQQIMLVGALLLGFSVVIDAAVTRRVTGPLKRLTLASEQLSAGNYDVDLPEIGRDEVGILTQSFKQLTEHLKVYISDLNSKAYKDALTSVKNKAAFELYSGQLDDLPPEERRYAVMMFDCNDLKTINDRYGHQKGDVYLQRACRVICKAFPHSPVFRVGGDEFVVILQNEEFDAREALLERFQGRVDEANAGVENDWEHTSLALGMAVYDPAADRCLADTLKRADATMYRDKKHWKDNAV